MRYRMVARMRDRMRFRMVECMRNRVVGGVDGPGTHCPDELCFGSGVLRARRPRPGRARTGAAIVVAAALTLAGMLPLGAQVAWDAPMFMAPVQPAGFGGYLVDPYPGGGIGGLLTWRGGASPGTIGFRVGIAEGFRGELAGYGGIDLSGSIHRADSQFPLDVLWVGGIGLGAGDYVLLSLPMGLTLGRVLVSEGVRFTPYLTPRLVIDGHLGENRRRNGTDLEFVVDLGADISFDPGWAIRFAATLGGRDALGIGISVPGSPR